MSDFDASIATKASSLKAGEIGIKPIAPRATSALIASSETSLPNNCVVCGLIFDVEPKVIGRSRIRPDLCILCERYGGHDEPQRVG